MVRQIQAANPDIVAIGTQPGQSIAIVRAINEVGLKAKIVGGGMTGLQTTDAEGVARRTAQRLREFQRLAAGAEDAVSGRHGLHPKRYQERAPRRGRRSDRAITPRPGPTPSCKCSRQAVEATKSTAGDKLGPYMHETTFKTIVGDVKFAESGEWAQPRMLAAQFQHVKGDDIEQFKGTDKVVSSSHRRNIKAARCFRSTMRVTNPITDLDRITDLRHRLAPREGGASRSVLRTSARPIRLVSAPRAAS